MKSFFAIIFTLVFVAWMGIRVVEVINFDRNCEGYLKRAADANTIELADKNLSIAVKYLEDRKMTSGYTSVLYRTPDEDVEFWYNNLRSSLGELRQVKPDASQLERTNVLMKLRETLLDQGKDGLSVTAPDGISVFPNNDFYCWWGLLSFIFACISCFWAASDDKYRYY